jgi:hypothetical protein
VFGDQVVVAVVVEDACLNLMSARRDHDVTGGKTMMTNPSQLLLSPERKGFGLPVDLDARKSREIGEQLRVIATGARRVPGLEEKGEAHGDVPTFDQAGESLAYKRMMAPRPSGVVDQPHR